MRNLGVSVPLCVCPPEPRACLAEALAEARLPRRSLSSLEWQRRRGLRENPEPHRGSEALSLHEESLGVSVPLCVCLPDLGTCLADALAEARHRTVVLEAHGK